MYIYECDTQCDVFLQFSGNDGHRGVHAQGLQEASLEQLHLQSVSECCWPIRISEDLVQFLDAHVLRK